MTIKYKGKTTKDAFLRFKVIMKRIILIILAALSLTVGAYAQSSMTDNQILQFVMKEHKAGTSQGQIVTKLMQRGVNISQIRRVRKQYEQLYQNKGLGAVQEETVKNENGETRLRTNNGEEKQNFDSEFRVGTVSQRAHTYDENDEDFVNMSDEMEDWLGDSLRVKEKVNKKKVFGRDIFNKKNLSFEPNMNIATPRDYRLGPGDAVFIDIYGASQRQIESTVSPDGNVTIEGFGPVQVSGLTVEQANSRLRAKLGQRYSSSQIKLTVGQTRTIMVNVWGEVKAPGTYTLSAFASVFHALYMAGGTNDLGTLRNVKVYRNSRLISVVDVYDYILNGKLSGDVRLADNDVIMVGTYDCLVNITGKVKRPMYYEMKKNESVGTLLKYAGGFTGDAYKTSVRLIRKTGRQYSIYNVNEFDMSSFQVADEDSVTVDSIIPRFENMVEVKGSVFRPGMYQLGSDINSVKTLLENSEGLKEDAFTPHAVMHRMREDRSLEVLSVDVDGILSGRTADIPLKPNDVLFIPTKSDFMEEQTVTINGEVHYPGIYKYAANETLEDLVLQAGGLKDAASTVKVDVARRIVNPKAESTDSLVAHTYSFALKDGFVIDGQQGFTLQPFDQVHVRRSPGYSVQKNVVVSGEIMFGGTYTISKKNTRLSDIVKEAGGVTDLAYIKGARLERKINEVERIRMESVLKKAKEQFENEFKSNKERNSNFTEDDYKERLKKYEVAETYYVGIELDKALSNPGSDEDLVLREGDKLFIPQYDGTVRVNGEVLYPNTVNYKKNKNVSYYINQAGGFNHNAKKSQTYIIYMNGTIARVGHDAHPSPGCEIVVPTKSSSKLSLAETLSIGTSAASIATMIATIANIIK